LTCLCCTVRLAGLLVKRKIPNMMISVQITALICAMKIPTLANHVDLHAIDSRPSIPIRQADNPSILLLSCAFLRLGRQIHSPTSEAHVRWNRPGRLSEAETSNSATYSSSRDTRSSGFSIEPETLETSTSAQRKIFSVWLERDSRGDKASEERCGQLKPAERRGEERG
jgi:hypothetical protein